MEYSVSLGLKGIRILSLSASCLVETKNLAKQGFLQTFVSSSGIPIWLGAVSPAGRCVEFAAVAFDLPRPPAALGAPLWKSPPKLPRKSIKSTNASPACRLTIPEHLSREDVATLKAEGVHVTEWEPGNATEHQLFVELPWQHVSTLLTNIANNHDSIQFASMIDAVTKESRVADLNLANDTQRWSDSPLLRKVLGDLAHQQKWIKRMDYSRRAFEFALPRLPDDGVLKQRLASLWDWIQSRE
jgi:hypothetical protein